MPAARISGSARVQTAILEIFTAIMAAIALLTLIALCRDIGDPNFWFDEAGQYWLAVGQNHFSPAGTPDGSLYDVWNQSKAFIADPGGFTLLLRVFVQHLGSAPAALRTLPALFGLLFLYATFRWSKFLGLATPLALAICTAFLASSKTAYFLLELRPYSMEMCGAIVLGLATLALLVRPGRLTCLVWIGVECLFATSRYSFVIYSVAACGLLAWQALRRREHRKLFAVTLVAAAAWNLVIYIFMLRFQSENAAPPDYVRAYMLANLDWNGAMTVLKHNFLTAATIGKTLFLLAVAAAALARARNWMTAPPAAAPTMRLLTWTAGYIGLSELGWLTLSAAGKMPWDVTTRWSLSEYGLSALALPGLCALVWIYIASNRAFRIPAVAILACLLLVAVSLKLEWNSYKFAMAYDRNAAETEHVYDAIGGLSCAGNTRLRILMDRSLWPDYRYLAERSGLAMPCAGKLTLTIADFGDIPAVTRQALKMARPLTILYGTWDPKETVSLRGGLGGRIEVKTFGAAGTTHAITLN